MTSYNVLLKNQSKYAEKLRVDTLLAFKELCLQYKLEFGIEFLDNGISSLPITSAIILINKDISFWERVKHENTNPIIGGIRFNIRPGDTQESAELRFNKYHLAMNFESIAMIALARIIEKSV